MFRIIPKRNFSGELRKPSKILNDLRKKNGPQFERAEKNLKRILKKRIVEQKDEIFEQKKPLFELTQRIRDKRFHDPKERFANYLIRVANILYTCFFTSFFVCIFASFLHLFFFEKLFPLQYTF